MKAVNVICLQNICSMWNSESKKICEEKDKSQAEVEDFSLTCIVSFENCVESKYVYTVNHFVLS